MQKQSPPLAPGTISRLQPDAGLVTASLENDTKTPMLAWHPIQHLTMYGNPQFAWSLRPESGRNLRQNWLPVSSQPVLVSSILVHNAQANLSRPEFPSSKNPRPSDLRKSHGNRAVDAQREQLRYGLLVFVLCSACWLFTMLLLEVLTTDRQDRSFSLTSEVAAEHQPTPRY